MTALAAVGASRAQSIMRFMVTRPVLVRETATKNIVLSLLFSMYVYQVLFQYLTGLFFSLFSQELVF